MITIWFDTAAGEEKTNLAGKLRLPAGLYLVNDHGYWHGPHPDHAALDELRAYGTDPTDRVIEAPEGGLTLEAVT